MNILQIISYFIFIKYNLIFINILFHISVGCTLYLTCIIKIKKNNYLFSLILNTNYIKFFSAEKYVTFFYTSYFFNTAVFRQRNVGNIKSMVGNFNVAYLITQLAMVVFI